MCFVLFFFFKQKTAYEMRISDWSSDVCSSDLTEQRLHVLAAWREAPFYSARERAALAWAEAVTLVASNNLPDALYEEVHAQFDDKAMVDLTLAIIAINGWNRLAIGFRAGVGRSEERRVGEECVSTCRYRGSPDQ